MYICMHVDVCTYIYNYNSLSLYIYIHVYTYTHICTWSYAFSVYKVCRYASVHACMYVHRHVRYVCKKSCRIRGYKRLYMCALYSEVYRYTDTKCIMLSLHIVAKQSVSYRKLFSCLSWLWLYCFPQALPLSVQAFFALPSYRGTCHTLTCSGLLAFLCWGFSLALLVLASLKAEQDRRFLTK